VRELFVSESKTSGQSDNETGELILIYYTFVSAPSLIFVCFPCSLELDLIIVKAYVGILTID
jgi:hypothetical protein